MQITSPVHSTSGHTQGPGVAPYPCPTAVVRLQHAEGGEFFHGLDHCAAVQAEPLGQDALCGEPVTHSQSPQAIFPLYNLPAAGRGEGQSRGPEPS